MQRELLTRSLQRVTHVEKLDTELRSVGLSGRRMDEEQLVRRDLVAVAVVRDIHNGNGQSKDKHNSGKFSWKSEDNSNDKAKGKPKGGSS